MYGIFGIFNFDDAQPVTEFELKSMARVLGGRAELFYQKNLGMGVISPTKKPQINALSVNENETVIAAAVGEVYNEKELIEQLSERHRIDSDTGLFPHLYEEFGEDFGRKINGHFSIALWDATKKSLLLMRDRFGTPGPIYYSETPNSLIFSSQLRRILQSGGIKKEVDIRSLRTYFKHSFIPSPGTIFKGIKKVSPGTYIRVKDGRLSVHEYWGFDFSESIGDERYALETFLRLMEKSVEKRLVNDGEVGAFLSGGIDSSLNVALASKLSDTPIHTFSVGFEDSKFSELPYAALVAEHFGTAHHEFVIDSEGVNCLPLLAMEMEEPFADTGIITMYYAQKLAKKNSPAVLTGDGSDQLFGYFAKYVRWRRKFEKIPGWGAIRVFLNHVFHPQRAYAVNYHTKFKLLFRDPLECFFFRPRFIEREFYSKDYYPLIKAASLEPTYREFRTFPEAYNYFTERYDIRHFLNECVLVGSAVTANMNSVTNRHTYLDKNVTDFITSLKADLKTKNTVRKYLIKKAAARMLPEETIQKYKQGRAAPFHEFLRNKEVRDRVFETLYEMKSGKFFNNDYVRKLEKRFLEYIKLSEGNSTRLSNVLRRKYRIYSAPEQVYNLYMFELWYRAYF